MGYIFLDFVMGSGKTITALGMLLNTGGNIIIIGNKASKQAFEKDAANLHID